MKLAHIINAVPTEINPQLAREQALSMQCMVNARNRCAGSIEVELFAVCFEDEKLQVPEPIRILPALVRSVRDKDPAFKKRLPFLKDILASTIAQTNADYIVYTNADICIVPNFYTVVVKYIEQGHDAIVINRRRVSAKYLDNPDFDLMFAETGGMHTGYDCFVFRTSLFSKFILEDVCIGVPPACNDLFHNCFCFAENPVLYTEKQLTYHIGRELTKNWGEKKLVRYNYREMKKIMRKLRPVMDISRFPAAELPFFSRHFKWFMNPTFSYPVMFRVDLAQLRRKRKPRKKPEVKGFKQRFSEWLIRFVNFRD